MSTKTDLDWLDLLPAGTEPEGLRAALTAQARQREAIDARTAHLVDARSRLADHLNGYADQEPDTAREVESAALEVVLRSTIMDHTGPVLPVPEHYADQIVGTIADWFRARGSVLGAPLLVLAECGTSRSTATPTSPGRVRPTTRTRSCRPSSRSRGRRST